MTLPPGFAARAQGWLGAEWADLAAALREPPVRGLRLHRVGPAAGGAAGALALGAPPLPLPADLAAILGAPVSWAAAGRLCPAGRALGRHPYHEAGAYYLQEPSAMAAAAALQVRPGERVLDLCAAPGGKASALGRDLRGQGELVVNEPHPGRAQVLGRNLERLGVPALITQEPPERLAEAWAGWFDAVLVDAPCSGEGMFRKDPRAAAQWSERGVAGCAARQRAILACAARLARPGGRVLYSTCTFEPQENEAVVAWALGALPVEAVPLPLWPGWEPGRPEWAGGTAAVREARRLWPHRAAGEGAFLAALRVLGRAGRQGPAGLPPGPAPAGWRAWLTELLPGAVLPERWLQPTLRGDFIHAPASDLPLQGLRVLRPGLGLARRSAGRLEPEHQLAMALAGGVAARARGLDAREACAYLAGHPLAGGGERGTVWVHHGGLPLGWARDIGERTNNLYPQGLRRQDLTDRL